MIGVTLALWAAFFFGAILPGWPDNRQTLGTIMAAAQMAVGLFLSYRGV
jgi:hypothetical protein